MNIDVKSRQTSLRAGGAHRRTALQYSSSQHSGLLAYTNNNQRLKQMHHESSIPKTQNVYSYMRTHLVLPITEVFFYSFPKAIPQLSDKTFHRE